MKEHVKRGARTDAQAEAILNGFERVIRAALKNAEAEQQPEQEPFHTETPSQEPEDPAAKAATE